jgi:hypothetical protein
LLELKRVSSPRCLRHLRYPFALEQLAKGYVLRGQGQTCMLLKLRLSVDFELYSLYV